jgi:hypothetical protein
VEARSVEAVLTALNDAGVRYLVAGGLAVVAHGHVRFTKDIDLMLALDDENARRAMGALGALGYRPVVAAVRMETFCDRVERQRWIEEKDAKVFQLWSDDHRMTSVDVFLSNPIDFDRAERDAFCADFAPGIEARFVGVDDLIVMKRVAGRPQDLLDVAELERLKRLRREG